MSVKRIAKRKILAAKRPAPSVKVEAEFDIEQGNPLVHNGWTVWGLFSTGKNVTSAISDLPVRLRHLLVTDGWKKFVVPYEEKIVEHETFAAFIKAKPPNGLGMTIDILVLICKAAGDDDDAKAVLRILEQEHESILMASVE